MAETDGKKEGCDDIDSYPATGRCCPIGRTEAGVGGYTERLMGVASLHTRKKLGQQIHGYWDERETDEPRKTFNTSETLGRK